MFKKLTKKEYLGEGYVHQFVNDKTGEMLTVPCTKEEYEALGGVDGHLHNPVMEGYTWVNSCGGTIKVDSPTSLLGADEYCDFKGGYFVNVIDEEGKLKGFPVEKADVVNNEIAVAKLTELWQ